MKNNIKFGLYLMTAKGLATLASFVSDVEKSNVAYVVAARDPNVTNDYYDEITKLAADLGIEVYQRSQPLPVATHLIAVSWRWLIRSSPEQQLIVFHDSILPRYRGFAPLVSALINGDEHLGVTALLASEEYDRGDIVGQEIIKIEHPIKINEAIDLLTPCYANLVVKIVNSVLQKNMKSVPQDESEATYSVWRDEADYYIDWNKDAGYIQRFVHALGTPYNGAATILNGETVRIRDCIALPDVKVENRDIGKVIFMHGNHPVIICGTGLIKILSITEDNSLDNVLPLPKFRIRLTSPNRLSGAF